MATAVIVSTERVRQFRERRRAGSIQLVVTVDEIALVERLIAAKLLPVDWIEDRDEIRRAVERFLQIFCEETS
jgi:hypothetical protein